MNVDGPQLDHDIADVIMGAAVDPDVGDGKRMDGGQSPFLAGLDRGLLHRQHVDGPIRRNSIGVRIDGIAADMI
jgi:hypothetical protein